MLRSLFVVLILGVFIFGAPKLSAAQHDQSGYQQETAIVVAGTVSEEAVNVGNKICPVSGEVIDEKTKATYEYEGKIYNFCCTMCIDEFKKDPSKYIKKVEEELQSYNLTK